MPEHTTRTLQDHESRIRILERDKEERERVNGIEDRLRKVEQSVAMLAAKIALPAALASGGGAIIAQYLFGG